MTPRGLVSIALLGLLVCGVSAAPNNNTPQNLQGSYDSQSRTVTLTWQPGPQGNSGFSYPVWRDGTYVGTASGLTFTDMPSSTVPDPGIIYFVSSAPPGNTTNVSLPAVAGVPTMGCEVVSTSTSWDPPFLYATLHMECIGVVYEKQATWTAPH